MRRILLVGGGSGGHVFPLVAVADALKESALKQNKEVEIILLGEGGFFEDATKAGGFRCKKIFAGKFRRYLSLTTLLDFFKMIAGFFQSFWHMFWIMPDIVFLKGGYASFFPALAAKFFFIPIFVHDSDSVSGSTNRLIGKWAKKVFVSFDSAKKYFSVEKVELVGNPSRKKLFAGNKDEALSFFKFSDSSPIVIISGGSQGAKKVNNVVINSIIQLIQNFQVIHQCGEKNYNQIKQAIERIAKEQGDTIAEQIKNRYRLYAFLSEQELTMAYAVGDVFVSRAGAGSLFEISALGKPAIVIPIKKSAQNHQHFNAVEFSKFGGVVLEEENLITSVFVNEIKEAYEKRMELGQKIKLFARMDAAEKIAQEILKG